MLVLSSLEKVSEILYDMNSSKGVQRKPVFRDEKKDLWVGKEYCRIYSANEMIACDLSGILAFPGVNLPEVGVGDADGKRWTLSRLVDVECSLRKDPSFRNLTKEQAQIGILFRMMGNVDGNMRNVLRDKSGKVWFIDYEYSGNFADYESRFLKDLSNAYYSVLFFMGDERRSLDFFKGGIDRVKQAVSEKSLDSDVLLNLCLNAGLKSSEADYYVRGVMDTANNLESRMQRIIDVWNSALDNKHLIGDPCEKRIIPFYKATGFRCGHACLNIVLDYFGNPVPSDQELDAELDYHRKFLYLAEMAGFLLKKGFKLEYFVDVEKAKEYLSEPSKVIGLLSKETAEMVLKHSDLPNIRKSLSELMGSNYLVDRVPSLDELADKVQRDCMVICTIDLSHVYGTQGYKGHHAVLTFMSDRSVYYQDVGPKNARPNQRVNREVFEKALYSTKLFDHNVLVVYPKRQD